MAGKIKLDTLAAPVNLASVAWAASYTFTRPNNTTAYTANDVIGDLGALGAVLPFKVPPLSLSGGEVWVDEVRFEVQDTGLISSEASHTIHFYSDLPPSQLADNAAFDITAADRPFYQGKLTVGTPVDEGSTLYIGIVNQAKRVTVTKQTLFAYLTTAGAYTPTASRIYRVWLNGRII